MIADWITSRQASPRPPSPLARQTSKQPVGRAYRRVRWPAAMLVVLLSGAWPVTRGQSTNDIPTLVSQLGAAKHRDREHAEYQLWLRGEPARPALEQAAQDPDPEVRQRARAILEKLDLGLRPDMPAAAQELIRRFHECETDECRQVIVSDLLHLPDLDARAVLVQLAQKIPAIERRMVVFAPTAEKLVGEILESLAANLPPPDEKLEALVNGLRLYLAVVPEDLNSPLNLILLLRPYGETKIRPILDLAAGIQRERLRHAPDSADAHNNLAWLLAVSRSRLDEALHHAQRAVELEPKQPAYLDTLAEVYFQKGDRQKALELIQRCLELDPETPYFRTQHERIRDGSPETPPPDPDLLVH